jgi:enoyl-CoA hydratase/carnithine racemase
VSAVSTELDNHVATVILDGPGRGNAFSVEMMEEFSAAITEVGANPEVRCVVITGTGSAFSTGADFGAMPAFAAESGRGSLGIHHAIERIYGAFLAVDRLEMPSIAAVNGHAIGGGFGVALLCDIRIVSERGKIGANFVKLGIHPGMAISHLLPEAVGYEVAAELLFTGRLIRGPEAVALGLARKCLPAAEVLPAAQALAAEIAAAAPLAVQFTKRTLRNAARRAMPSHLHSEAIAQALLMQTDDAREGIAAMLTRREPHFKGR